MIRSQELTVLTECWRREHRLGPKPSPAPVLELVASDMDIASPIYQLDLLRKKSRIDIQMHRKQLRSQVYVKPRVREKQRNRHVFQCNLLQHFALAIKAPSGNFITQQSATRESLQVALTRKLPSLVVPKSWCVTSYQHLSYTRTKL